MTILLTIRVSVQGVWKKNCQNSTQTFHTNWGKDIKGVRFSTLPKKKKIVFIY